MIGNALSGLILSAPAAAENLSPGNPSPRIARPSDDSFSGIFREKLREASSKPARRAGPVGSGRSPEPAMKVPEGEVENTAGRKRPKSTEAVAAIGQVDRNALVGKSRGDQELDETKIVEDDHSVAEEASDLISLAAALLESLFEKPGETAAEPDDQANQAPVMTEALGESRFEAIKGLLEGKIENLMELIEKIGPDKKVAEISELIDELKSLLAQVDELKGADGAGAKAVFVIDAEEATDIASLIARLHSQATEIMDKLKVRITEAVGQDKPVSEEPVLKGEVQPGAAATFSDTETKDDTGSKAQELKTSIKDSVENDNIPTPKAEAEPGLHRGQAIQEKANPDVMVMSQRNEISAAKPEKAELHLSGKPLAQTVTNQFTMRLKLMAGENRQEMEVQLKPESLGKLTLRIVHERGEILAKITAENDQVKSILESNMQLLKDSLEKNGFTVQSLNVSVGDGNGGGRTQDNESEKEGSREARTFKANGGNGKKNGAMLGRDMPDDTHSIDLSA